ncbi:MAG: sugar phosphate isomerase/epimerase [Planctomycetes bacterium]|nr:sugar phosphate isomerase/epimerase [Planctomycetota bacterium]HPF13494.1 TIM barrel protein [Planctomycetota bacterium]HRV82741.1 TIM barrel protein [Planctomycetota bacterium]
MQIPRSSALGSLSRRQLLRSAGGLALGLALPGLACSTLQRSKRTPDLQISLAQWSLHRALWSGELDPLDFSAVARDAFGIGGVEYVNTFFKDHVEDQAFLTELRDRAAKHHVRSLLIMIDAEGDLGAEDPGPALDRHRKWIDAAAFLGCHSIRVNAGGPGSMAELAGRVSRSLRALAEYGAPKRINVIVENHGGYSSNGAWLAGVMELANHPGVGTLPDFGNFRISADEEYDRYRGVREMMPYAKAVSAKSYDFDADGNETHIDFARMLQIVRAAGYKGYLGIEYEGDSLSEYEGIQKTGQLLRSLGVG